MKIKTLFAAILAAGLLFSGCRQDEDYVLPSLKVGTESLEFGQLSTEQVVEISATRDWMVRNKPDWVAVDPASGPASSTPQRVTLTVLDNSGYNRVGDVLFSIGLAKAKVAVAQAGAKGEKSKGTGTLEDPYTAEGAREAAAALGADVESPNDVYIKGKISRIADKGTFTEGGTYGNASFYISDDGATGDGEFYCYRILYLGNKKFTSGTDIKVGDEVIVCGKIVNFRGNTPETVASKAFLYSLNGVTEGGGGGNTGTPKGTGTQADPYNAAGATAAASALASGAKTETDVYVKGKISRIATDRNGVEQVFTAAYGNASFYISEDGSQNGEFYCFRVLYLGNKEWKEGDTQIKVGDEVIICGKLTNYQGAPETSAKEAYIYSLNGTTEGGGGGGGNTGTPKGTGTQADPYNAAAANAAVANLTWTSNTEYQTTEDVYVRGKISRIASKGTFAESGTNGNASFYISDDGATGGAEFYCFRILYLGNAKYTSGTDIKVGDEVIVYGKLMNYRGNTPETVAGKAYLYSLNGTTEGGGGGGQQTEVKTVTVAEFIAAEPSNTQKYQLTGKVTGSESINETYGNFYLEDATGTVYVYGLTKTELGYGATNDKSFASIGIKAGDTVTLIGYRDTYKKEGQDDRIEVVNAYYVSHTSGANQ